jgi:hypothetical protein
MIDSITVIPQFLSALPFFGTNNDDNIFGVEVVFGLLLLTIGIYVFILRLFVFKTAWLIDKLQNKMTELNKCFSRLDSLLTVTTRKTAYNMGLPQVGVQW